MDLVVVLVLCVLVPAGRCATGSVAWCYDQPQCSYTTWPTISTRFCNGSRQSPIDIVSASVTSDSRLTGFTFQNYDSRSALTKIENTGRTVKVSLASGIQISGGGLPDSYDSLQFHLHWGNGASVPGSEHTVDGKRFPMELHIVNSKSSYNQNTTQAIQDSTGLAALGFFIEEMSGNATASPSSWQSLTSYLANITVSGQSVTVAPGISLDDLLVGVDRTKFYRYLGSLTTPTCNEAVVWTVFKDSIKVSKDLIDLFSNTVRVNGSTSDFMTNVYRGVQPSQPVTTQPTSGASRSSFSLGLGLCAGLLLLRS